MKQQILAFYRTKSSWYAAQYHCAALDRRARLATVAPSAGDFTEELVAKAVSGSRGAWIGLSRLEPDDAFGWVDGTRPVVRRWSRDCGDGDCVHIWGPEGHWTTDGTVRHGWNDAPCHTDNHILCQIELNTLCST
ncbi:C-type lectin [Amphibalanus amphitrite]|uniref:C-type lectin n=1 Tax=Amphibalanus amphitrite TaxID=1232801 RepID=A0A6A4W911_AMPAM|nr:C-type lectin [Amphibalanus amphitrite]